MDASALPGLATDELRGARFACLEGCGFCCTMQPEVSNRELALLRARFKPRPVNVIHGEGRTYLQLQNKCGACTLLERRACGAYDLRPQHCRYFPFHVHFAERPEVYLNYTCRGVERAQGDLAAAFGDAVLANARADDAAEHLEAARGAYAEFRRRAQRAGAWGDADAALAEALAAGPALLTRKGVEAAARRAAEPLSADEMLDDALAPFARPDVSRRPFYLAPDLRWLTFEREGKDALRVLEMDERGALTPAGRVEGLSWRGPDPDLAEGLLAYLRRLAARRLFVGSAYAVVDDTDYESTVEEAVWWRVAEVSVDLVARALVLDALGTPRERLADEVARFYDTTFLDSPAIGGFL